MSYVPGNTPPTRRGPHPLKAFLGFATLVAVGVLVVFAITSMGRLLQR